METNRRSNTEIAHPSRPLLGSLLIESGVVTTDDLASALSDQVKSGRRLGEVLLEAKSVTKAGLTRCLAVQWGCSFLDLEIIKIDPHAVMAVSESLARYHQVIPVALNQRSLTVAMVDPLNYEAVQNLSFSTGLQIIPAIATLEEIKEAINRCYPESVSMESIVRQSCPEIQNDSSLPILPGLAAIADERKSLAERSYLAPIIRLADMIIRGAVKIRASDIHIEPGRSELSVRYRIDGLLREEFRMTNQVSAPLISRIKVLAQMDIAERRMPQDGSIRFRYDPHEIDLRVSTLPTHYGEKMVIRVLDRGKNILSVDQLGLSSGDRVLMQKLMKRKQGILLVTGPTGSGKTTSLYSILRGLASETRNVVTVEDPIEYQMDGINQVQVKTDIGLTFAACLRAILRQDPDVMLIGEIRDLETAEIAMRAAITGHLVLSTLHTYDAPSAVTRLIDLGIPRYLIPSAVIGVVAQRLVRQICPRCKSTKTQPVFGVRDIMQVPDENVSTFPFRLEACSFCGGLGTTGRTGIFEILEFSTQMKESISNGASEQELRELARECGMVELAEDGMKKINDGIITLEELSRVVEIRDGDEVDFECSD